MAKAKALKTIVKLVEDNGEQPTTSHWTGLTREALTSMIDRRFGESMIVSDEQKDFLFRALDGILRKSSDAFKSVLIAALNEPEDTWKVTPNRDKINALKTKYGDVDTSLTVTQCTTMIKEGIPEAKNLVAEHLKTVATALAVDLALAMRPFNKCIDAIYQADMEDLGDVEESDGRGDAGTSGVSAATDGDPGVQEDVEDEGYDTDAMKDADE
jgi:hypothetical protein